MLSLLQPEMISAHIGDKIYQLSLIILPHYRVKYEQVQFCKNSNFQVIFYIFFS